MSDLDKGLSPLRAFVRPFLSRHGALQAMAAFSLRKLRLKRVKSFGEVADLRPVPTQDLLIVLVLNYRHTCNHGI